MYKAQLVIRHGRIVKKVLFLLLWLSFSLKTQAQGIQEYFDPYQLIKDVAQKARENDKIKSSSLTFERTYEIYDLNPDGRRKTNTPKKTERLFQGTGRNNERLPLDMNRVLEASYFLFFEPTKIQYLDGSPVYVVRFFPKNKNADGEDGYYKAANRSEGKMYIDKEHLYTARIEAIMNNPFNIFLGLGRLRYGEFTMQQKIRPDLNDIVVIEYFTAKVRYRSAFSEKYEEHVYSYSDYQLVQ